MSHAITIKVRGYHLDLYRHVNNARYLEFLEEARWSFLESRGSIESLEKSGHTFAVVNININYRRAAYMGEVLQITTVLKAIGSRSCVMRQLVTLQAVSYTHLGWRRNTGYRFAPAPPRMNAYGWSLLN